LLAVSRRRQTRLRLDGKGQAVWFEGQLPHLLLAMAQAMTMRTTVMQRGQRASVPSTATT
jgi:hypothetical protein